MISPLLAGGIAISNFQGAAAFAAVTLLFQASTANAQEPALAPPTCDYGEVSADAAPQLSQFDFLIGDFTIVGRIWADGAWGPIIETPRARLRGRYILGGLAIQDEWYDNDPGVDPETPRGMTTRFYDSDTEEWKVSWMYSRKTQVTDLRVKLTDGVLTMRTANPEQPNYDAFFERTGPDTWTRTAFREGEDGSRTLLWQAIATRIPCPSE